MNRRHYTCTRSVGNEKLQAAHVRWTGAMRGAKIAVHRFTDGRLRFSCKDRVLSCTAYGTHAVPDPAEVEKTLDARLDLIARRAASPPVMSPHWLPEPVQPAGAVCHCAVRCSPCSRPRARCAWLRAVPLRCAHGLQCSRPGRESRRSSRTGKLDRWFALAAEATLLFCVDRIRKWHRGPPRPRGRLYCHP